MKEIELDGTKLLEKDTAQQYLKEIFGFSDEYGNNLDALKDALYDIREDTLIHVSNDDMMIITDSEYASKILKILVDVSERKRNLNIAVTLDEDNE